MGKSSGSAPQAPDPAKTIPLQERSNMRQYQQLIKDQRADSANPYGASDWTQGAGVFDQTGYDKAYADWQTRSRTPTFLGYDSETGTSRYGANPNAGAAPDRQDFTSPGEWSHQYAFNPEQQATWTALQNKLNTLTGSLDPSKTGPDLIDDAGGLYSDKLAKSVYDRMSFLTEPQVELDRQANEQRMADRGFSVGSAGYTGEMGRFEDSLGRTRTDRSNAAQIQAAQQALAEAGFTNNARMNEFRTDADYKAQLASLLSGQMGQMYGGLTGSPSSFSAPQLGGVDIMGAYNDKYMGDINAYNSRVGSDNAMMGTLGTLGSAALMMGTGGAAAPWLMGAGALGAMNSGGGGGTLYQSPGGVRGTGFRLR